MQKKGYNKIPNLYMKNTLNKLGIEANFLNLIKHIYKIPIVNIIYSYENLKLTPLLSGTRQRLSPVLLSSVEEKTQTSFQKQIYSYYLENLTTTLTACAVWICHERASDEFTLMSNGGATPWWDETWLLSWIRMVVMMTSSCNLSLNLAFDWNARLAFQ